MMQKSDAERLLRELEPVLPTDTEITSVPWSDESPRAEWIVSLWDDEGNLLADVFGVRDRGYVVRQPARGPVLGETKDVAVLAGILRSTLEGAKA